MDWDELAVNQSILRGRRVRLRLGTWGGERRLRKGGFRARIEALLVVWGQAARAENERRPTPGSLGVKGRAFLEFSQVDSAASAEGWLWSLGRVGSLQKTGSLAAAAGCP